MSKFDFKKSADSSKSSTYDRDKYKEACGSVGAAFFGSNSKPSNVAVIRTWLTAGNWLDSVEEFDNSATIYISDTCDSMSFSMEDARKLLVHLQALVEDTAQIREALTEVLPMNDSSEDD